MRAAHIRHRAMSVLLFALAALAASDPYYKTISSGVVHQVYRLPGPNVVNVVRVDRREAGYRLKIGFPWGRRNFSGRMTVPEIVKFYDRPESKVVAAINASFFGESIDVIGAMASDGTLIQPSNSSHVLCKVTRSRRMAAARPGNHVGGGPGKPAGFRP